MVDFGIRGSEEVAMFEGFMDYLSYLNIGRNIEGNTDYLVLNGLGFFEKARTFLETHENINLFLDRDATGTKVAESALKLSKKYRDKSSLYRHYKDMNEWLMLAKVSKHIKRKLKL